MQVALIGSARFGVGEPVEGGMESMVRTLALELCASGHDVTIHAGVGAAPQVLEPGIVQVPLTAEPFTPSPSARKDVSMPPEQFMAEHHAFLALGRRLCSGGYDVVHNHSSHYLPPLYETGIPMLHTLHTPPTPWLESALALREAGRDIVVTVSAANAERWGPIVDAVVPNGIDLRQWTVDLSPDGGGGVIWSGRLVPEKGAHLAIDAARRAGRQIDLAGPRHDVLYFESEIQPRLGDGVRYLGHLGSDELAEVVARASAVVVTPRWDEPYGLVVAEALAAGTPVAAFRRGGVPEILDPSCGALAEPDDVASLAAAVLRAVQLDPRACRRRAETHCSSSVMARRYEALYESATGVSRLTEAC